MWLIHVRTMRLVHIADEAKTPRYAILSHTWLPGQHEVSFQDMSRPGLPSRLPLLGKTRRKPGWHKVANTCRLALGYGCEYAWIDTCCIDTSSSAELQESINSMFRWYERAEVCFVHLADVSADEDYEDEKSAFRAARWFRRGWTLQELLAPATLVFYDRDWRVISDKEDANTRRVITEITGIDDYYISRSSFVDDTVIAVPGAPGGGGGVRGASRTVFGGSSQWLLSRASVAEKMSWAAGRETTRQEDMAYCLLGIFDINMPMLYGEGSKAFQRLQEEIMRVDDDCSLLAWGWNHRDRGGMGISRPTMATVAAYEDESSLLAPHPSYFSACRGIRPCSLPGFSGPLFSMNQRGLRVRAPVRDDVTHAHLSYVVLGCGMEQEDDLESLDDEDPELKRPASSSRRFLAIPLVSNGACKSPRSGDEMQSGEFYRPSWCKPTMVSSEFLEEAQTKEVLVRRAIKEPITIDRCAVRLLFQETKIFHAADVISVYPPQPIPGALASLGRTAIQKAAATVSSQRASGKNPAGVYEHYLRGNRRRAPASHDQKLQHQPSHPPEDVQVMIHLRIPSGELVLITVELSESPSHRSFRCRMFKCARQLGFEDLHALSVSQDYLCSGKQLEALGCRSEGGFFSFRVEGKEGVALEAMYTSMSDVDRVIIGIQEGVVS
jgi:hypothetical protein